MSLYNLGTFIKVPIQLFITYVIIHSGQWSMQWDVLFVHHNSWVMESYKVLENILIETKYHVKYLSRNDYDCKFFLTETICEMSWHFF